MILFTDGALLFKQITKLSFSIAMHLLIQKSRVQSVLNSWPQFIKEMSPKWQKFLFFFAILVSLASIGTILSSPVFLKKRVIELEFCKWVNLSKFICLIFSKEMRTYKINVRTFAERIWLDAGFHVKVSIAKAYARTSLKSVWQTVLAGRIVNRGALSARIQFA